MDEQNTIMWIESMQHDLRTPLTGMMGFAKRIQAETMDPIIKNYADQLVLATEAFIDFQHGLLEAGNPTNQAEVVCLQSLCEKVLNLLRPAAVLKKIALKFEYHLVQHHFFVDSLALFRILSETITNAIKFTEKGEVTLIVTMEKESTVQFEIRDTGIGIAKNHIDPIFDWHYRVLHHSDISGEGVGLASVKRLIKTLNASIQVISELNQGASFFYTIPLLSINQSEKPIPKNALDFVLQQPCTVLLIEDHKMTANINQYLLQQIGCDVDWVLTGCDAIASCRKKKYDIIFLDLHLPDMTSQQVIDAIQDIYAVSDQQPEIIGLTAYYSLDAPLLTIKSICQKPLKSSNMVAIFENYGVVKSDDKTIDLVLGAKRIHQDEAAARDMLTMLIGELPLYKKNICDAMSSDDYVALEEVIHTLLGGLAYCGAPKLELACRVLKKALERMDRVEIKNAVNGVLLEIERLKMV